MAESSGYYLQFLEEIDGGPYDVSNWEADFIESLLEKRPSWLSDGQKNVIRRMAKKYLQTDI